MTIQIITIVRYAESEYIRRKFQKYVRYAILLYTIIEITYIVQNVDIGNIYNIATNLQYQAVGIFMQKYTYDNYIGKEKGRRNL